MNGRVLRYRKPTWLNWTTEIVDNDEAFFKRKAQLESLGYVVEG